MQRLLGALTVELAFSRFQRVAVFCRGFLVRTFILGFLFRFPSDPDVVAPKGVGWDGPSSALGNVLPFLPGADVKDTEAVYDGSFRQRCYIE